MKKTVLSILVGASTLASGFAIADAGYYGSVKLNRAYEEARRQDTSERPGATAILPAGTKHNYYNSSLAGGYDFGNGWRSELEYTFKKKSQYTADVAGRFAGNLNHLQTDTQRLMVNAYHNFELGYDFSVFGNVGLGWARVKADGKQWRNAANGNPAGFAPGDFEGKTNNNFVYSLGAGVSYSPLTQLAFDLGYRYVDLGKVETGWNNFTNARERQDEKIKAHLYTQEYYLGVRYTF